MPKTITLDNFALDDVREQLNAMTIAEVIAMKGAPREHVTYAKAMHGPRGPWWKVGDERPTLANDDPAVMQSVGRCAATRRTIKGTAYVVPAGTHPSTCEWCDYPLEDLLKACAWAVHQSGFIESHVFEWTDEEGRKYVRSGGDTGYRNRVHRSFWELDSKERERRVEVASGREALTTRLSAISTESKGEDE